MQEYVLDDHDEEGQLDAECFGGVNRTGDEGCGDIGAHDL